MRNFLIINFFLLISSPFLFGQFNTEVNDSSRKWFIGFDAGVQMSGIKSVDFVSSNYSSLIKFTGGKWLNSSLGIQFGYQGMHFNTIADNDKHFYNFYFFEGVLNFCNLVSKQKEDNSFYDLVFHAGLGIFQNRFYRNSSIHYVLGAANNFSLSKKTKIKLDIGAIVGWDIYQGDYDILPSLSLGFIYLF